MVYQSLVLIDNNVNICVANNSNKQSEFIEYVTNYNPKDKLNYVSIDFEFNRGKIALMQINFGDTIWLVDPAKLMHSQLRVIRNKIFLNDDIYKIFHGADNLDLPYIYKYVLNNNPTYIIQFMHKFFDTRFYCEYIRKGNNKPGKCGLYDLFKYSNVITESKYNELNELNDKMGPIQDVYFYVNKLTTDQIKYAYNDVLYLTQALLNLQQMIIKDTPNLVKTFYYIHDLIRFIYLERKGVTSILSNYRSLVGRVNGLIVKGTNAIKLFDDKQKSIDTNDINFEFIKLSDYIRNEFILMQRIIYYDKLKLLDDKDFMIGIRKWPKLVKLFNIYKSKI